MPPAQMANHDSIMLDLDEHKRSSLSDRAQGPQGPETRLSSEWSIRLAGGRDGIAQSSETGQAGKAQPADRLNSAWVWRPKDANSAWQRFFMVVEEAELKTFKDDKVTPRSWGGSREGCMSARLWRTLLV